jgi:hypothetical protein
MTATSASNSVTYSEREQAALGLLRQRKVITPEEVEHAIWPQGKNKPFNARLIAAGVLRSLKAKSERNREAWRIETINRGRLGSKWELKRK